MTEQPETMPELLNAREVAQILRISERSVWRLVSEQKLIAPLRIGGSARWPKSEIQRCLQSAATERDARSAKAQHDQQEGSS